MVRTTSISSKLMTELLTWRNPQGAEKGWFHSGRPQEIPNRWSHAGKVVTTELGLMLLTAAAAIETVVYVPLITLSALFSPLYDAPFKFFNDLIRSSGFTIIRSMAAAAIDNVFLTNVLTEESFVRFYADQSQEFPMRFSDTRDEFFVNDWYIQNRPWQVDNRFIAPDNPFFASILAEGEGEIGGVNFIIQHIWPNLYESEQAQLRAMDGDIFPFVTAKAVFISILQADCDFFKIETQEAITALRQEGNIQGEIRNSLQTLLASKGNFDNGTEDPQVKPLLMRIKEIASHEMQGGLFVTKCLGQVCSKFPGRQLIEII